MDADGCICRNDSSRSRGLSSPATMAGASCAERRPGSGPSTPPILYNPIFDSARSFPAASGRGGFESSVQFGSQLPAADSPKIAPSQSTHTVGYAWPIKALPRGCLAPLALPSRGTSRGWPLDRPCVQYGVSGYGPGHGHHATAGGRACSHHHSTRSRWTPGARARLIRSATNHLMIDELLQGYQPPPRPSRSSCAAARAIKFCRWTSCASVRCSG